jgi:hypothetical protein
MNNRNVIIRTGLLVTLIFSLILIYSCTKKGVDYNDTTLIRPCDNVICLNGGTCLDGNCSCPLGYEGAQCQTKWSDKFIGNYVTDDDCDTTAAYGSMVISADPVFAYKLRLFNLGLFCTNTIITADINPEKTSFSIPLQNTCGSLYLSGYGNRNGNFINVYLTSRDSVLHSSSNCSIVLSKQ